MANKSYGIRVSTGETCGYVLQSEDDSALFMDKDELVETVYREWAPLDLDPNEFKIDLVSFELTEEGPIIFEENNTHD